MTGECRIESAPDGDQRRRHRAGETCARRRGRAARSTPARGRAPAVATNSADVCLNVSPVGSPLRRVRAGLRFKKVSQGTPALRPCGGADTTAWTRPRAQASCRGNRPHCQQVSTRTKLSGRRCVCRAARAQSPPIHHRTPPRSAADRRAAAQTVGRRVAGWWHMYDSQIHQTPPLVPHWRWRRATRSTERCPSFPI